MLRAASAYFALVFCVGFLLGTIRVLAVAPVWGEGAATAIELPFMLAVSWVACSNVMRRFEVPGRLAERLVVGLLAFCMLMLAEVVVGFGMGRGDWSFGRHLAQYRETSRQLGLAAQVMFGLLPVVQMLFLRQRK